MKGGGGEAMTPDAPLFRALNSSSIFESFFYVLLKSLTLCILITNLILSKNIYAKCVGMLSIFLDMATSAMSDDDKLNLARNNMCEYLQYFYENIVEKLYLLV